MVQVCEWRCLRAGQRLPALWAVLAALLALVQASAVGADAPPGPRGDERHFVHRFEEYTREQEEQEILGDGWSNYVVGYRSSTAADFNPGKPETATDDVDKSKVGLKIPIAPQGRISWIEDRKKARTLAREGSFYLAKQQYQYILRKYNSLRSRSVHDMHIELGQLLVIIGEPEEALRSFREALSFQPESHIAHYHLGMPATRVGSFADAVQHYKNALFYDSKHCQTLHNLGSLLFFSLQFEEAEYYFLNAIDTNACTTKGGKAEELAQSNSDVGSEAGGIANETLPTLTNRLLDHFFGAFVAKIQDLDPLTDGRLQRYYRQLSDEERNMVTANMLIHSGEAMYSQGLVKESISMWKCVLDMYNVDTGGLKLQVAMAVPMYLSAVAHAGKVYEDIMGTLNAMLSSFDQETDSAKRMRVPYPEIRCRISTVLTSLEFHFSTIAAYRAGDKHPLANREDKIDQYGQVARGISNLIRRVTPSMNFVSSHLVAWNDDKQRRQRRRANGYIKVLRRKNANSAIGLPVPKIKIGFVSGRFHSDSIELRMIYRFITETSYQFGDGSPRKQPRNGDTLNQYHTTLITSGYAKMYEDDRSFIGLRQTVDRVLFLGSNTSQARKTLSENAVDILIFISPTKDEQTYWLSYGRYAPVQIVYGAGSGTTGLQDSIDYFLVSDNMASQDIANIHSEQVIRLRGRSMAAPIPLAKSLPKTARSGNVKKYKYLNGALFLFELKTYYFIPHDTMAIMHPEFDHVIQTILESDQRAEILFAAPKGLNIAYERLTSRIRKGLRTKRSKARLRFLPALTRNEFLSLLASVDLVLDPFPGSGTGHSYMSSLESLMIGTPVLTLDLMSRGVVSSPSHNVVASMLRTIDKTGKHKRGPREKEADNDEHRAYGEEFIAINETNYIDIALDFPKRYQNVARKARLKEYLRENTKVFYEDTILLDDFSKFIHRISRVGGGAAADDSKVQKNAANTISLPEERVAHFFFKEHGHTIPKRKKKRRNRKE